MIRILERIRTKSPGKLPGAFWRELEGTLSHKLAKWRARRISQHISDGEFLLALRDQYGSIAEFLNAFGARSAVRFFLDSNRGSQIQFIDRIFPEFAESIVGEGDRICSHVFNFLGSGDVDLDKFIEEHGGRERCGCLPWHFDFKGSYRWNPKTYYRGIEIPYGKADIKVPWELSRFQHVTILGQAYWLSGDARYAQEFVTQVEDWIDRNPPKFGVNWRCTMDVAIRVVNWILGYYFYKDSKALADEFLLKLLKNLLAHGHHIMANLENRGVTTNHYLSDLVGLIYLGITFPEFKEAKQWREFGIQELIKEMEKQVYDDGMDFEASTCYHRLSLELFFYPALLCKLNGIELPDSFIRKLKKMFDFVLYVLKPNGRMPQIGDNDNGRLHVLGKREILDMSYLLTFATLLFNDPKYKIGEFGFAPEALWVFGPEAYERWQKMPGRSIGELESKAFRDGGIYVMRHKKDYMVISCGPNGQNGLGGHAHNDKLGFELSIAGEDFIVDPGTYIYTAEPDWRDTFRSTAYHNTIIVDGMEQNKFEGIFRMKEDATPKVDRWESNDRFDLFDAEHNGYERLTGPVSHRRQIYYDKDDRFWLIRDMLKGKKEHSYDQYLHLASVNIERVNFAIDEDALVTLLEKLERNTGQRLELDLSEDLAVRLRSEKNSVLLIPLNCHRLKSEITEGWISSDYGEKRRAPVLRFSKKGCSTVEFLTLIIVE